jgi:autotransporter adhesin
VQAAAPGAGGVAVGYQSNATGTGGVAIGNGAVVQSAATNGVAIGAGSVASAPNTVSFGTAGNERRLTNVAPGVNPTDAANLGQLTTMFNTAQDDISRANGGVGMALAAASVQLPLEVGEMGVVGGVGVFRGQTAFNFKYQMRPTEDITFGVGVGVTTRDGNVGASAGVGYKWR